MNPTTKTINHVMLNVPVKLKTRVKNNVESPMITAKVPTIEARSFKRELIILPKVPSTQFFIFFTLSPKNVEDERISEVPQVSNVHFDHGRCEETMDTWQGETPQPRP